MDEYLAGKTDVHPCDQEYENLSEPLELKILNEGSKIKIKKPTEFISPHWPEEGPDLYHEIRKTILDKGLRLPTGYEISLLLKEAYYSARDPKFKGIIKIVDKRRLWMFTRNLWLPVNKKSGVYVVPDSLAFAQFIITPNELEKKLDGDEIKGVRFSKDRTISFAPYETIKFEEQESYSAFANNGFVIASFGGREGAENMAEVSSYFKEKPEVYGIFGKDGKPCKGFSYLASDGMSFVIDGDSDWTEDLGCGLETKKETSR